MDASTGFIDPQNARNFDPLARSGAAESLKTMPVVFDEAFQAGIDCFGHLLEQYGLTRDKMRLLRSFADVISAAVLRRCSEAGAKSFVIARTTSKQTASSLSMNNPNSTKSKKISKRKEPLEKKSSIRAAKAQRYLAWLKVKEDPSDAAREELRRCAALVRERKQRRHSGAVNVVHAAAAPSGGLDSVPAASADLGSVLLPSAAVPLSALTATSSSVVPSDGSVAIVATPAIAAGSDLASGTQAVAPQVVPATGAALSSSGETSGPSELPPLPASSTSVVCLGQAAAEGGSAAAGAPRVPSPAVDLPPALPPPPGSSDATVAAVAAAASPPTQDPSAPPCPQCAIPFPLDFDLCSCRYNRAGGTWECSDCYSWSPNERRTCTRSGCDGRREYTMTVRIKGRGTAMLANWDGGWDSEAGWGWSGVGGVVKMLDPFGEPSAPAALATVASPPAQADAERGSAAVGVPSSALDLPPAPAPASSSSDAVGAVPPVSSSGGKGAASRKKRTKRKKPSGALATVQSTAERSAAAETPAAPLCLQCSSPFPFDSDFCCCGYFRAGKWECARCSAWLSNEREKCSNGHAAMRLTKKALINGRVAISDSVTGFEPWRWADGGGLLKHVCLKHPA